jgi:hypothetical protein
MMKLVVAIACAGCAVDEAAPVEPAANTLATSPMVGPFSSIELACASTAPCGGTEWNDDGEMIHPTAPDCSEIANGIDSGDVRIAGVGCSVPNPLAMSRIDYQAYVHRDDGWWRSDALVTVTEHHHCDGDIQVAWETGGAYAVARIATTVDCVLARQSETLDYLVAIDPIAAQPMSTSPLIVGEHVTPKFDDGDAFDAALDAHWTGADTVSLDGPTQWRDADTDNDGATMSYFDSDAASPAGIWNISR